MTYYIEYETPDAPRVTLYLDAPSPEDARAQLPPDAVVICLDQCD